MDSTMSGAWHSQKSASRFASPGSDLLSHLTDFKLHVSSHQSTVTGLKSRASRLTLQASSFQSHVRAPERSRVASIRAVGVGDEMLGVGTSGHDLNDGRARVWEIPGVRTGRERDVDRAKDGKRVRLAIDVDRNGRSRGRGAFAS